MKKSQLLSQPLIFIFAIIVVALIFIYGFYLVQKFSSTGKSIEIDSTLIDLKERVQTYYNLDPGSSVIIDLPLPKEVKYFCFVNLEEPLTLDKEELWQIDKDLHFRATHANKNLIILPSTLSRSSYNIPHLKSIENPLCIRTLNKLKATIENKGTYVEIKQ